MYLLDYFSVTFNSIYIYLVFTFLSGSAFVSLFHLLYCFYSEDTSERAAILNLLFMFLENKHF